MIKRALLITLTILVVIKLLFSLVDSFNQPQIQSLLELYQSEIILQASEYKTQGNFSKTRDTLLGEDLYAKVQKQYEKALTEAEQNYTLLTKQQEILKNNPQQQEELQKELRKLEEINNEIRLKINILQAKQGQIDTAVKNWQNLSTNPVQGNVSETAKSLISLWQQPPQVLPETEPVLRENLEGWFRYTALKQLYQQENNQANLASLEQEEQAMALKALVQLFLIAITPFLGVIIGVILLVLLLIQWWRKGKEALLSSNSGYIWEVPWDGEIVWQVLIVGFFFISQYVLPVIFSFAGLNPSELSIRFKALYVLASYLSMAGAGLLVLYLSIRSFRPFPPNWFRFQWGGNWIIWGLGGYIVAFPLVLLVSLINQQLWQGQGGSNPLILLALESQDKIALLIFFSTAAIAAPLFEEIIFRGFLLASLTRYLGSWSAIIISSLIFSIAHLSLSEVLPLTMLGIILGFVYSRSRNLLSPILLHSLWNSGTLLSLFILGR